MNWETKYITHPEYPGWRKRKLVSPDGVMQAMVQTFWERIPGSDPSLPAPPGANRRRINPPWGKWGGRSIPPVEMPNPPWGKIPKTDPGFDLQNWGNTPMPSPMEPSGPRHEYGIRNLFANPSALRSLRERGPSTINPPWANPGRENPPIHPSKRKYYPAEFDPATGQNRVNREEQARIINKDRGSPPLRKGVEWNNKMQEIQEAYYTGADFGYEEGWPERLGVTYEMIDMFMSVPEEAIIFAFENPTDMVLEEFERKYGFPLNVNSPALREQVEALKRRN